MIQRVFRRVALPCAIASVCVSPFPVAFAQQTLGSLNGTITDPSGAIVSGATVHLTGDQNGINLSTKSKKDGTYQFENLPVGVYTLTFTDQGFDTSRIPHIPVQENRAGTINVALKTGQVSETVDVNEKPLMNETDATNGYVLDSQQIQETPLATGSFTRLATLAPGVSGELLSGIGTNAGLGNQPIWANGQRDTSNGFAVDGVDVTNLFNGKSSSESSSQRYAFNIGQGSATAGQPQTNTSVFGSNGQGLATPPPEFIQELRVNTSEYDAQQGNHSGAQIDVNTATGTNTFHGQAYGYRATNAFNADPYFNKQGVLFLNNLPAAYLNPSSIAPPKAPPSAVPSSRTSSSSSSAANTRTTTIRPKASPSSACPPASPTTAPPPACWLPPQAGTPRPPRPVARPSRCPHPLTRSPWRCSTPSSTTAAS